MEKGKHKRRKVQIFEKYSVLILIATMLMSIGYAEITGVDLSVTTNVESTAQDGVFITDITRTEYEGADITLSQINSYIDTTMNSTVVLGGSGSYITYNVSVYNKTDREQVFIGPFGLTGEGLYDNSLITYELSRLTPYETILEPGKNYDFDITFKYAGSDMSDNTLTSRINFRFMEVLELALTNEGEITGIYPGYTPQEYEFTVSNYNGENINNVALSYGLTAEIQKPFIAKIYDSTGAEVTSATAIDIAGKDAETGTVSKVDHKYKLKIMWDNTNPESGVVYNSANYANKTYTAKINVIATPKANADGDKKYADYTLNKAKDITVKTAPMYFTPEPNNTTIEMTNNRGEVNLAVSNNNGSEYNPYEIKYTISQDNSDFVLYVDEVEYAGNITGERAIGTGEKITLVEKIWLVPKTGVTLNKEETANITITVTSPYINKTETIQIKVTDTTGPTAPTITGGSENFTTGQIISVSEVATDVGTGVKNYEYLVNNTDQAVADATGNVGSTEEEKSKTFDTDYNGYYIWFRAVDKVGNKGEWSNSQQLNIETTAPTITLGSNSNTTWSKTGSVTVKLQDTTSGLASGASIKYGWSTSQDTAPGSYTEVTPTYTDGTTSEVTFTAEASGLTGKYYLWVVPTTLEDKAGNEQTTTVKSTGQFYFDNNGPTAGTLTMKLGNSSGSDYTNDSWTNQSVYVAVNNGSDGSGESGHGSTTWTIGGTAQDGTSTTLDPGSGKYATYSIVVTTADVAGNTASNTYTVKIDKAGPSAPTISGGGTSWATSVTIKVDTASIDTGVGTIANYEYYLASDSTAPTASTTATASLGSGVTSKVFNDNNYNGYYVYFRAVDGVGNKGAWSSTQRLYVDTVSPTVTANNATLEITEGDSNTFDSLFTVTWGGITTGTTAYTLNGASTSYTNTSQLAVGTHTLKCTVTKNNGEVAYASVNVSVKAKATVPSGAWTYSAPGFTAPTGITKVLATFENSYSDGSIVFNVNEGQFYSMTVQTAEFVPAGVPATRIIRPFGKCFKNSSYWKYREKLEVHNYVGAGCRKYGSEQGPC